MRKTDSTKYQGMTDLEFVEGFIERLNRQLAKLPTEHSIRFLPCEHCGQIFMEINFVGEIPITEHERKCASIKIKKEDEIFELAYIETGRVIEWETEDIEYARQCADEKWRSNH